MLVRLTSANHVLIHHLELLIGVFPLHAELAGSLCRTIAVLLFLVEELRLLLVNILLQLLPIQRVVVKVHGMETVLQVLLLTEELLPAMIEMRVGMPLDGVEVVRTLHVLVQNSTCLGLDLKH